MRAPTIAWWSDQRIGKVERRASSHMDILPTLAHLAGAALPPHLVLDGVRLSSSIQRSFPSLGEHCPPDAGGWQCWQCPGSAGLLLQGKLALCYQDELLQGFTSYVPN